MTSWQDDFAYLTTVGRASGRPHTIEIWFAFDGEGTVYLLSGGGERSDWVRNLKEEPEVRISVGDHELVGRGRVVEDLAEDERARDLVTAKYQARYRGDLSGWRRRALPVAIDLG